MGALTLDAKSELNNFLLEEGDGLEKLFKKQAALALLCTEYLEKLYGKELSKVPWHGGVSFVIIEKALKPILKESFALNGSVDFLLEQRRAEFLGEKLVIGLKAQNLYNSFGGTVLDIAVYIRLQEELSGQWSCGNLLDTISEFLDVWGWGMYGSVACENSKLHSPLASKLLTKVMRGLPICEAYPKVPENIAISLAWGTKPMTVCRGLNSHEAHQYLLSLELERTPIQVWLLRDLCPSVLSETQVYALRDLEVARWILYCSRRDPSLESFKKIRSIRVDGVVRSVSLWDHLDTVESRDLVHWVKSGVVTVLTALLERLWTKGSEPNKQLAEPPTYNIYPRSMVLLNTRAALTTEGREMRHCVSGFHSLVANGMSAVYSIRVGAERATLEIDLKENCVKQLHAAGNTEASPAIRRLVKKFVDRNGISWWDGRVVYDVVPVNNLGAILVPYEALV